MGVWGGGSSVGGGRAEVEAVFIRDSGSLNITGKSNRGRSM